LTVKDEKMGHIILEPDEKEDLAKNLKENKDYPEALRTIAHESSNLCFWPV